MRKAWSVIEEGPYCFSRSCFKFQGNTGKKKRFGSDLSLSGRELELEMTDGYLMTRIAFRTMEEVLYWFTRPSAKFQGHTGQNIDDFMYLDRFEQDY